jgi:hypothetical protein
MNRNKMIAYVTQAIAGLVAWKVTDKAVPRPEGTWPTTSRLAVVGAVAMSLALADAAIERKLGVTSGD